MSKQSKTFRIEEELIATLEDQAKRQSRSLSNLVHGYLEDRVSLASNWAAFDETTYDQVKAWIKISSDERAKILAKRRR